MTDQIERSKHTKGISMLTGLDLFLLHLRNSGNCVKQWPCPKNIEISHQWRQPSIYPELPPMLENPHYH